MCLPPCEFSCSPVQGDSFVNFLGTCQTTRVIAGKTHSQSPILKTKGALSNLGILTCLQQSCILHTLNKLPASVILIQKVSSMLEEYGLYISFGGGRCSFWQSWLTRASRLANSQASALNAGVPTALYLFESNCSYLALIWSVKELYSLWASCTVIKKTGFGMMDWVIE